MRNSLTYNRAYDQIKMRISGSLQRKTAQMLTQINRKKKNKPKSTNLASHFDYS